MKTQMKLIIPSALTLLLAGCSAGDLRAWNDAMAQTNGYTVTYPDQSDTTYVGPVEWVSGVRNGEGFMALENTSSEKYCKARITFEDETTRTFYLDPGEYSGRMFVSLYNQDDYLETICNTSSKVFNASWDD